MSTTKKTVAVYWRFAKKHKRYMWRMYPAMAVAQLAEEMLLPLLVSGILTDLAAGNLSQLNSERLLPIFAAIVGLEVFSHLLWIWVIRNMWRWQETVMRDLHAYCFGHLSSMSYGFFSNQFAGSLVNQANKFVSSFERLTDSLTWNVFKLIIGVLFTIVVLAPQAAFVVLGILIIASVFIPVVWVYRRRQIPFTKKWAAAETARTGQLADSIGNILAVKSFAHEDLERGLFNGRLDAVYKRSMDTMNINMNQEMVSGMIQRSINVMTILVSVWLAVEGYIEVGVIYLALTYTTGILRRLWDLNNTFRSITRVFGDAHDMTEILQIQPDVADPARPDKARITKGRIEFKDVGFRYQDQKEGLFMRELNLLVKSGQKIGLVGPSGGGKTTVTKLLLRFMDIQEGAITIDGQDISTIRQQDLRSNISYVPQEPLLFHRSLADNIRYGNPGATDAQMRRAAKLAHAEEFIADLPDGYDTLVGERGVKLSGGQKQRVAIARSILKDAPIILLDEATSALDSESERLIQAALKDLMKGRTSIVIAHRLSTIQSLDRILVLKDGEIIEDGTHTKLIEHGGLYAELWSHQSGGFIEE